jgi:LacI family transcriptional regulator
MRARLIDVAARAGVAPNTASTILNNRPNSWASKETRDRVLKAAEDLGYKPSKAALGLRLGRFFTLGLVIPDIHNPFYTTFADLLDKAVSPERYDLIIEHGRTNLAQEKHSFEAILERQVDGVALFVSDAELHRPVLQDLANRKIPAVALVVKSEDPLPIDAVLVDFAQGLQQAVEHLLGHGHRRFVFLCALAEGQRDGERPDIFRQLMSDNGIPDDHVSYVSCGHDIDSARSAFRRFLQTIPRHRRPTAVIAMNDLSAIGAMRAAVDEGLTLPRDLSVVGVDNIPLGQHLPVSLTTIAQPIEDMARRTASLLLQRIAGQKASQPAHIIFPTELIVRESTGPAAH